LFTRIAVFVFADVLFSMFLRQRHNLLLHFHICSVEQLILYLGELMKNPSIFSVLLQP